MVVTVKGWNISSTSRAKSDEREDCWRYCFVGKEVVGVRAQGMSSTAGVWYGVSGDRLVCGVDRLVCGVEGCLPFLALVVGVPVDFERNFLRLRTVTGVFSPKSGEEKPTLEWA